MERTELQTHLHELLMVAQYQDYCPNGLQVEGRSAVSRIVCGVTACQRLLELAVAVKADTVIVHHGYFWRGEAEPVVGMKKRRLATLLKNDINLFAYHLPLDAHAKLGNNAQLALAMGWLPQGRFGQQDMGWTGILPQPCTLEQLTGALHTELGRMPLSIGEPQQSLRRIAWCTGGGQGFFEQAVAAGADVFVSGEISEQTTHIARETGVAYIAAGHHATERYGIRALTAYLQQTLGLQAEFMDVDNPA